MKSSKQVRSVKSRSSRNAAQTRREAGAAAVEFALVVPLLLLLVFGIIDFGVLFSQQLTLNNAVREGDRRAVVWGAEFPRTCDGIIASVKNELSGLAMEPGEVWVKVTQDWTSTSPCGGDFVQGSFGGTAGEELPCLDSLGTGSVGGSLIVEARYVADIMVPLPPFRQTLALSSKAVFRCEFTS